MTAATTAPMRADWPPSVGDRDLGTRCYRLDDVVADPAGLSPVCDEPEFAEILREMVAHEAPRLFAVVQEYGVRVDARIAAWGIAFADHAEVVSVERARRMSLAAADSALSLFSFGTRIRARLVWVNADVATAEASDERA